MMEIIEQNANLVVIGIAVVFFLIWRKVAKKQNNKTTQEAGPAGNAKPQSAYVPAGTPKQVIAAVTAAVNEYRNTENRE